MKSIGHFRARYLFSGFYVDLFYMDDKMSFEKTIVPLKNRGVGSGGLVSTF